MTELLVDLGNSQAKLSWLGNGQMRFLGTCDPGKAPAPLLPGRPERIWVSSVATSEQERKFVKRLDFPGTSLIKVRVVDFLRYQPSRYAPDQLGVDRWLAVLACRERGLAPAVVVDLGTATTLDFLDSQGLHTGGYILPGPDLMQRALLKATALRTCQGSSDCNASPPARTGDAITCGILQAQVGAIERALAMAEEGASLVLTGGAADLVRPLVAKEALCVEQLVLEGLAVLARGESPCAG